MRQRIARFIADAQLQFRDDSLNPGRGRRPRSGAPRRRRGPGSPLRDVERLDGMFDNAARQDGTCLPCPGEFSRAVDWDQDGGERVSRAFSNVEVAEELFSAPKRMSHLCYTREDGLWHQSPGHGDSAPSADFGMRYTGSRL